MTKANKVYFETEYIKLDCFLKLANACSTGGEAKMVVQNGEVTLNGEICLQRGRKLRENDLVCLRGLSYLALAKIK